MITKKISSKTYEFSDEHEEYIVFQYPIQSEDEIEISEDESVHTNSEQRTEISTEDENVYKSSVLSYKLDSERDTLDEESVQTPTTTSYELEPEIFSKEENEVLNKNWVFSNVEQGLAEMITKHELSIVLKLQDHGMDIFSKDNEALHGASMALMMVMSGSHSFTLYIDIAYSNGDGQVECKDHECLRDEKTHIRLISGNGRSPCSDMFEDK